MLELVQDSGPVVGRDQTAQFGKSRNEDARARLLSTVDIWLRQGFELLQPVSGLSN